MSLTVETAVEHQGGIVYDYEETKKGRVITPRSRYKMIRSTTTDIIENMLDTPEGDQEQEQEAPDDENELRRQATPIEVTNAEELDDEIGGEPSEPKEESKENPEAPS